MNCYYHVNRPAVAICSRCGKCLCRECLVDGSAILCSNCIANAHQEQQSQQLREKAANDSLFHTAIFLSVIFFAIAVVKVFLEDVEIEKKIISAISSIVTALFIGGIPYGWRALSKTKLNVILALPILGWAIYFALKLQVSFWIGGFMFIGDIIKRARARKQKKMLWK